MSSSASPDSGNSLRRISIRQSRVTSATATASVADEALRQVLDRRLRKREGRPPAAATREFGSARSAGGTAIDRPAARQWFIGLAAAAAVAAGVGVAVVAALPGGGRSPGVAVEGRVLFNGQPLAQAALEFHRDGADGPVTVVLDTNETGAFRRPVSAGIPVGSYSVVVKSGCIMPSPQAERGTPVRIPAKYTSVRSTPLKATVASDAAPFEFVLR